MEEPLTDLVEVIMKAIAGQSKPGQKPAVATYVEEALDEVTSNPGAVLAAFVGEIKTEVIDSVKQQKEQRELDAAIEEFNKNKDKLNLKAIHHDNEVDWEMQPNLPTSQLLDAAIRR